MDFIKLPENSEKLLLELIQADNPVQMLGVRFEQASQRDDDELRGMLRELRERGYYQSAYCLNEAGILWYQDDVPVIPIALPEINSSNMYGFLCL